MVSNSRGNVFHTILVWVEQPRATRCCFFDATNLEESSTASQQGCKWPIKLVSSLKRWDTCSPRSPWVAAPPGAFSRALAVLNCFDLQRIACQNRDLCGNVVSHCCHGSSSQEGPSTLALNFIIEKSNFKISQARHKADHVRSS